MAVDLDLEGDGVDALSQVPITMVGLSGFRENQRSRKVLARGSARGEEEAGDVDGGRLVPDLQKIATAAKHQLSLINDILDLSKVEAGRMELEVTDFDLPAAIDNALTLVRERATRPRSPRGG
jgi:signal transduction histidine kinase